MKFGCAVGIFLNSEKKTDVSKHGYLEVFGLNVFISILQHVSHITTCKFLGLERKHIAYLVLLLQLGDNESRLYVSTCGLSFDILLIFGLSGQAMVLGNFKCRSVLLIWIIVGQGVIMLPVGAVGVVSLLYSLSFSLSLSLSLSLERERERERWLDID